MFFHHIRRKVDFFMETIRKFPLYVLLHSFLLISVVYQMQCVNWVNQNRDCVNFDDDDERFSRAYTTITKWNRAISAHKYCKRNTFRSELQQPLVESLCKPGTAFNCDCMFTVSLCKQIKHGNALVLRI